MPILPYYFLACCKTTLNWKAGSLAATSDEALGAEATLLSKGVDHYTQQSVHNNKAISTTVTCAGILYTSAEQVQSVDH